MKNLILALLQSLSLSQIALAGGLGNGGYAYVCRDPFTTEITSARLLDLWDIETFKTNQSYELSVEEELKKAYERVSEFYPSGAIYLQELVEADEKNIFYTKRPLSKSQDAFPRHEKEPNCDYEQVARYDYNPELGKVVLEIYEGIYFNSHFSNSDRAALRVHEPLYNLDRKINKATTSDRIRILNADLFSDRIIPLKDQDSLRGLLKNDYVILSEIPKIGKFKYEFDVPSPFWLKYINAKKYKKTKTYEFRVVISQGNETLNSSTSTGSILPRASQTIEYEIEFKTNGTLAPIEVAIYYSLAESISDFGTGGIILDNKVVLWNYSERNYSYEKKSLRSKTNMSLIRMIGAQK